MNQMTRKQRQTFPLIFIIVVFLSSYRTVLLRDQIARAIQDDSPKKKPYLVIHAGAHKTATTTVQLTLAEWKDTLKRDKYVYLGKFVNEKDPHGRKKDQSEMYNALFGDKNCLKKIQLYYQNEIATIKRIRNMSFASTDLPQCWIRFLEELDRYEGQNLIISEEGFGNVWPRPFFWPQDTGNSQSVFRNIEKALADRWEIVVVVAYRRLFEWLPSAKHQVERYHPSKKSLVRWPQRGGVALKPLFFNLTESNRYEYPSKRRFQNYLYTNEILDYFYKHNATTVILNFHSKVGVQTEFFCNAMPAAPHMCARSKRMKPRVVNEKHTSQEYDRLATAAASLGWIDTERFSRRNVSLAAQLYHLEQNKSPANLLKACPTKYELQFLLDESLRMERIILPKSSLTANITDHQSSFWKAVAEQHFCSVDTIKELLEHSYWKQFFSSFQASTSHNVMSTNKT